MLVVGFFNTINIVMNIKHLLLFAATKYTNILPETMEITDILKLVFTIINGLVGIAAVGGLIYGGVLYLTASGSPDNTKKAMGVITNTVIVIVVYAALYLIMEWLLPGFDRSNPTSF